MSQTAVQALTTRARAIRDDIDVLNKELSRLNKEKAEVDNELMEFLEVSGVDRIAVDGNIIAINEEDVATITDWDALHALLKKHDALYVLHRRFSVKPLMELVELVGTDAVPATFDKVKKISFRRG